MTNGDGIIRGGTLLPGDGDWEPWHADVRVRDGRIVEMGRGLDGPTLVDARGMYVLPGLVNAHLHLGAQPFRFDACRSSLEAFVHCTDQFYDGGDRARRLMEQSARSTVVEAVVSGTTVIAAARAHPYLAEAGLSGLCLYPVMRSQAQADLLHGLAAGVRELASWCRSAGLRPGVFVPSLRHVDRALLELVCSLHRTDEGLRIALHVLESPGERAEVVRQYGETPVELLDELGLLGPRTTLVHCCHMTDADIALVAGSGTHVVLCPTSNAWLHTGRAPLHSLREAGVPWALGTDGPATGGSLNLFQHTRLAACAYADAALTPEDLLAAVTSGPAQAVGVSEERGAVRVGAAADLVLFDEEQFFAPRGRVLAELTGGTVKRPDSVLAAGRVLVAGGRLVDQRLREWAGAGRNGAAPAAWRDHWHSR